jgi:glycosyltransferase involved in cell wall biosynthesis
MGYFPNANAALWFATEVFPLIRQQIPHARFLIVGAEPTAAVSALAKLPNIVVTGYVPQVENYLQQATVAVAPMQSGSGIQNKVLEGLACGTPMVVTPYALGGIEVVHDEHLLVASSATDFAQQVIRLLHDTILAQKLAKNGRELVEAKYTWSQCITQLEQVYALAQS